MKFSRFIKSELDIIIESANLTEDEEEILKLLGKGKSIEEVAMAMHVCRRTIDKKIYNIKSKINKIEVERNGKDYY